MKSILLNVCPELSRHAILLQARQADINHAHHHEPLPGKSWIMYVYKIKPTAEAQRRD
jgi:hypothetical protein